MEVIALGVDLQVVWGVAGAVLAVVFFKENFHHQALLAFQPLTAHFLGYGNGFPTMGALAHAVNSGKALYVGLSNYDGENLRKATAILEDLKCPFIINQNRYSIFDRTIEQNGLKETSKELGRGIIAFSPLAQGLLTNRYLNGIPEDSRVKTDGRFLNEALITEEKLTKIRALNEIAKERGQTLAEMALSWILKDGDVTSVLIGASKSSQILDNIASLKNTCFSQEELMKIDKIVLE